mmetsp:Transcript_79841/g.226381  ORF Transcript_79841/g.226381 Transcript_79841/m.226381 type:complete len:85 (+) Transcript_79841:178-432(+)
MREQRPWGVWSGKGSRGVTSHLNYFPNGYLFCRSGMAKYSLWSIRASKRHRHQEGMKALTNDFSWLSIASFVEIRSSLASLAAR